ncbi:Tape measure domain protein [Paramixta manurensis]|uniref:Tape measure domain protein n=1 Tax=Paramixta manurensis TaxID=2740817 RepID=A0A6M8U7I8_9GAMM|nr:Tape measure domain protein [Erwiniaceae bacterium PD-1]
MLIRELLVRLGLTGGEATGRDLDKIDVKVNQLMDSFRSLSGVLSSVLSVVNIADEMQLLEFRLGKVITTTNGGAEAMDNLSKHANDARVNIEAYADVYSQMGAATHGLIKSQQDLLNITDSVEMGLQLAGASTQQTTNVIMQLTQAMAVGKLQWSDMQVIMQNSEGFASRLAASLGTSLDQMAKAAQGEGSSISSDRVINALRNISSGVKEEFSSMPMTFEQGMTVVANRWDMFIHRLSRSTAIVPLIANDFLWLADKVEYIFDQIINALGGAENAVKWLSVAFGAAGLVGIIGAASTAFTALISPVGLIIAGLILLYGAAENVYRWFKKQPSLLDDFIGPAEKYHDEIDGITKGLDDLAEIAKFALRMLENLKNFMNSFQDSAQSLGDKLGTTKVAPWIKQKLGWFIDDLSGWASQANEQTYGVFDVPKMWNDMLSRIRESNRNSQVPVASSVNNMSVDTGFWKMQGTLGAKSNSVTISIGTISVPPGTTQEQMSYLNDVGLEVFNDVGYRLGSLGDDMNFNRG